MRCSCQQQSRSTAPSRRQSGRAPSATRYPRCRTAGFSIPFLFLCILCPALAVHKPSAPKEWHVPASLGGIGLYKALVEGGARANQTDSIEDIDSKLMAAVNHSVDRPIPAINVEAMLSRVILQQQPQQAIDAAFSTFPRPPPSPPSLASDTAEGAAAAQAQPSSPSAAEDDLPPTTYAGLTSAHPSLSQAIEFVLNAPQGINTSFVHINELSHHKVWLAVAQIRAIAAGRGACEPPPGTDLGGWKPTPLASSDEDAPAAEDEGAGDTPAASTRRLLHSLTEDAAPSKTTTQYSEPEPEQQKQQRPKPVCSLTEELRFLRWLITLLPQRFSVPLLRRMTVAALLQRRSTMPGYFSPAEQKDITLLFLQFYVSHRTAAMKKSVVEFFHISKAGGTSMCSLSQKNGCTTWDAGEKRNCLVYEFDDLPHWVSKRAHLSMAPNRSQAGGAWFLNFEADRNQVFCARRRHFMQMKGWDMYAHEYTLVGGRMSHRGVQLCTEMLTMLQVRHPYTRLVSHLRWVYGLYHERILNTTAFWPNTTSAHWQYMAPPVVDNYYTRSLLGEATYKLPAGRVTAEHGAYAQLLVAQYDVLLVLEQSNSRKLGLGLGLGWKDIEQTEKHRSADDLMAKIQAMQNNTSSNDPTTTTTDPTTSTDTNTDTQTTDITQATSSDTPSSDAPSGGAAAAARRLLSSDSDMAQGSQSTSDSVGSSGFTAGSEHGPEDQQGSAASSDKMQSLLKAATSPGVPEDLGVLLAMNEIDHRLYQFASWLARFDAAVLETVKIALGEDAYAGLGLQGDPAKQQARVEARERKIKAERYHAKMVAAAIARGAPVPVRPHAAHASNVTLSIDDPSTCGFAGY